PIAAPTAVSQRRNAWIPWAVAALALLVAAVFAMPGIRHVRENSPPEMRLQIETTPTAEPFGFAMSPDGQYIVFVTSAEGGQRLWLRALAKTEAQPMAGTRGC